jgi:hypothetical protein
MKNSFSIKNNWMSSLHELEEVKVTSSMMEILLGDDYATRNVDDWSKTVQPGVRLSAYPLALWFASSWWRLRWEPLPIGIELPIGWRMAHEMTAAGYGYVWPQVVFASDGDIIQIASIQSSADTKEPIHFLTDRIISIDAILFEREIDKFVNETISRLSACLRRETDINTLWSEITEERHDPDLYYDRSIEAMLGFDPDECPDSVLSTFKDLVRTAGKLAVGEIAPVCATPNPIKSIADIIESSRVDGLVGRINDQLNPGSFRVNKSLFAWECGWQLAKDVRASLRIPDAPLRDDDLCELVGLSKNKAFSQESMQVKNPIGIAVKDETTAEIKYIFRKRQSPGRRFEIARFICDYLVAGKTEKWLPSTDAKTARQKMQRSFAAEFLCPIESIRSFIGDDYSDDSIQEAANYFNVAPMAIQTQLVGNRILPASTLSDSGSLSKYYEKKAS